MIFETTHKITTFATSNTNIIIQSLRTTTIFCSITDYFCIFAPNLAAFSIFLPYSIVLITYQYSMEVQFPKNFLWGTSTAAYQIETASEHDWKGVNSKDGHTFLRTADHELRRNEDLQYISLLGNAYRMSMDWAKLQSAPNEAFNPDVVAEYRSFLAKLKARNIYVMMVLHHFTNPLWFVQNGSWENPQNIPVFINYVEQMVDTFGDLIDNWNTFNEPEVYLCNSRLLGNFPPFKKSWSSFNAALNNMSRSHKLAVKVLKNRYPRVPVGISKNCAVFAAENWKGWLPAKVADYVFMNYIPSKFMESTDYFGMSYYARIPLDPYPITEIDQPGKLARLGRPHDKMWEYYPEGMYESIRRYWKKYNKPIVITESGICTPDSEVRIASIKDYLRILRRCMDEGIDIKAFFEWTTMDNFEWNLGPTYQFGLVAVDYATGKRRMKSCGEFYSKVVRDSGF